MKRLTLCLIFLLLASPAWAMSTVYRHLEPETVVYQTLPSAAQTQFTTNENIKLIKYGSGITLSSITANLSQVNGTAFVSNPSVDLRPYVGFKGTWSDVSTHGVGFFAAAGTGETLATTGGPLNDGNLFTDSGFAVPADWTAQAGWAVAGGFAVSTTGTSNHIYQSFSRILGALYKESADLVTSTGGSPLFFYDSTLYSPSFTSLGTHIFYDTCTVAGAQANGLRSGSLAGTMDNRTSTQVLTPSATGTTITATPGGAQNWTTQGSTPNAATFTVVVTRQ